MERKFNPEFRSKPRILKSFNFWKKYFEMSEEEYSPFSEFDLLRKIFESFPKLIKINLSKMLSKNYYGSPENFRGRFLEDILFIMLIRFYSKNNWPVVVMKNANIISKGKKRNFKKMLEIDVLTESLGMLKLLSNHKRFSYLKDMFDFREDFSFYNYLYLFEVKSSSQLNHVRKKVKNLNANKIISIPVPSKEGGIEEVPVSFLHFPSFRPYHYFAVFDTVYEKSRADRFSLKIHLQFISGGNIHHYHLFPKLFYFPFSTESYERIVNYLLYKYMGKKLLNIRRYDKRKMDLAMEIGHYITEPLFMGELSYPEIEEGLITSSLWVNPHWSKKI